MTTGDVATRGTTNRGTRVSGAARAVAAAAGVFFILSGLAAFAAPEAFFEAAATFEPYNEHFVRDIGAFQLGLGMVLLLSVWIEDAAVVALGGVGVGSLVHTLGHGLDRHLGGTPAVDIPFFGALSIVLLGAALMRWRSLRRTR
jgi:uncharacterized protein YjeT (DUF2065 family)